MINYGKWLYTRSNKDNKSYLFEKLNKVPYRLKK
jgi:hypothetical protein